MSKVASGATLRDVAAAAGVSLASASCALGQGRRGVSDQMRERVQRAASELGYEVRRRGRPRARPLVVGVVVPDATNSFFSAVLGSLGSALRREGHRLLVTESADDPEVEGELVELLSPRVDALAIAPAAELGRATEELAGRGVPVVLFDRDGGSAGDHLPAVVMDNRQSARRGTMVLVESGFRRIALVNGPQRVSTARHRTDGYLLALAEAGLARDDELIWTGEFSFDDGRRAVNRLLRAPERPDAIFSSSAILTSGVLMALREHGLRWPGNLAVVGYGDGVFASLVEPSVTVVEQPTHAMGETVARLLVDHPVAQPGPTRVVLSSKLVVRDSHWRTPLVGRDGSTAAGLGREPSLVGEGPR
ncbi:MAG: LacI family DNA-binding transcriptional regulator [Actinomycetota bacterium]|nr:LacI family DNA-binding transcriptional regulator [Actinomycetota bacterium]